MNNKEEERSHLVEFFKFLNIPPSNYTLHPNGENTPPDACFEKDNSLISIEHTRLTNTDEREKFSIRRMILEEIQRLYPEWSLFSAYILFVNDESLSMKNKKLLAQEIVNTVKANLTGVEYDRIQIKSDNTIISLRKSYDFEHNKWRFTGDTLGWVNKQNKPLLESIHKKSEKLLEYRNRYDKNWIYIHISRLKSYGKYEINHNEPICTIFDKVFVAEEDQYTEMKVIRRP